ncbi:MAG: FxLYD domain-containing protein [Candidatus Acidiferrales bacterium]
MPDNLPIERPERPEQNRPRYRIAWMGAATVAIALVIVMWPGAERPPGSRARETHLPFGSAEQAYAPKIQIDGLALSRAENFLNQEVTTLAGRLTNAGNLPLSNVELTVEFSDELGQVVLRESRAVFASPAHQLAPGEGRNFEISFEHLPSSWNIQQPAVRVSGILFSSKKE